MLSALFLNKNTIEKCSKENKKNRNLDKNALRKNLHSVKITQSSSDVFISNNTSFNSLSRL